MGNEIINQVFVGTTIFGTIIIIVAIILAFLPIYFMIGTLTRLTDIKYKLDDILVAISPKDVLDDVDTEDGREVVKEENSKYYAPEDTTIEDDQDAVEASGDGF